MDQSQRRAVSRDHARTNQGAADLEAEHAAAGEAGGEVGVELPGEERAGGAHRVAAVHHHHVERVLVLLDELGRVLEPAQGFQIYDDL